LPSALSSQDYSRPLAHPGARLKEDEFDDPPQHENEALVKRLFEEVFTAENVDAADESGNI
jgi:hypothetical protein